MNNGFFAGWFMESGYFDENPTISKRCIEGHWMQVYTTNYIISVTLGDLYLTARAVLEYLMDLLQIEVKYILILSDEVDNPDNVLKLGIKKCEDLIFEGKVPINNNQLASIIESTNAFHGIFLQIPIHADFHIDPIHLNTKYLSVMEKSTWFQTSMLFDVTCSNMMITNCALNAEDCLRFIRRWYNSEDTDFEWLYSTKKGKPESVYIRCLDWKRWDEERRVRHYRFFRDTMIDCRHG